MPCSHRRIKCVWLIPLMGAVCIWLYQSDVRKGIVLFAFLFIIKIRSCVGKEDFFPLCRMHVLAQRCAGRRRSFLIRPKNTKELLINEAIHAKEVRLVGDDGEQLGIVPFRDALNMAYDKDLDLVLMAPNAVPPVCRIMDYGKYRFDREKREKEARKKQQTAKVKEIQLSCGIDVHDFDTRVNHAKRFLGGGDKVRVVVRFRGREMSHQDVGREVLSRFSAALEGIGVCDKKPVMEGRNLSVLIIPVKNS